MIWVALSRKALPLTKSNGSGPRGNKPLPCLSPPHVVWVLSALWFTDEQMLLLGPRVKEGGTSGGAHTGVRGQHPGTKLSKALATLPRLLGGPQVLLLGSEGGPGAAGPISEGRRPPGRRQPGGSGSMGPSQCGPRGAQRGRHIMSPPWPPGHLVVPGCVCVGGMWKQLAELPLEGATHGGF